MVDFTQGNVGFLTDVAQTFCNYGYLHEASNICHMGSDPLLDVLEVEILGTLKHSDAVWELIKKVSPCGALSPGQEGRGKRGLGIRLSMHETVKCVNCVTLCSGV